MYHGVILYTHTVYIVIHFFLWVVLHCLEIGQFASPFSLDYLQFGAVSSETVVNICVQFSVWAYPFISLESIQRSGVAGSEGRCMLSFVRTWQTVFQHGCAILCFHQQCMKVPVPLHPCQHWVGSLLNILVCLVIAHCNFN